MSLVHNERLKLTATWLNGLAAAIVITGVVAPVVAAAYGVRGTAQIGYLRLGTLGLAWFAAGTGLQIVARRLLGRLRP